MFASIGISEEQIFGDLYLAWLKDTGEKNNNDSRKPFREVMERGFGDRQIILRKERLGANFAASLAALLHRSPLTRLDLHGNTLRDSGCEMIAHLVRDLPSLAYLDLGANDIGPPGIQALSYVVAGHRKLQTLILGSSSKDAYANRINAASATILLEGCLRSRTLRHIDLSGSAIGTGGGRGQAGYVEFNVAPPSRGSSRSASSLVRRTQVAFSTAADSSAKGGCTASNGEFDASFDSSRLRNAIDVLADLISTSKILTTLKLREAQLTTDAALRIIHAAMQSSSFAFIDLSCNFLTEAVCDAFGDLLWGRAKLQTSSGLHTILLSNNPLMRPHKGMPPPRLFQSLSSDCIVVRLYLDNCGIDDAAIASLCCALATNGALQSLHLRENAITEEGAVMLSRALCQHSHLQDVSLEGNVLKDEGACAFASVLETNGTLLSLNLAHTWMGERGVVALGVSLAENKTLQRLNIAGNHFTDDAGDAFAALLESNRSLLRCVLCSNSIGYYTVLRVEKITARNREAYRDMEKNSLEKEVIWLHYQMYKLDEAKTELENMQQKKAELGRALEAFEVQFKQDKTDAMKKERDLQDALESCLLQETRCFEEKKRLDDELEAALAQTDIDMDLAKERLEAECALREKVEEEHRQLKLQLEDMINNGDQREAAKRLELQELIEDSHRWTAQRKEYRNAINELQVALKALQEGSVSRKSKSKKRRRSKKKKNKTAV